MKIKRHHRSKGCVLTAAILVCGISRCGMANSTRQTTASPLTAVAPTVKRILPNGLTRQSLSAFQSAFTTLSNNAHVTIIVEGVPLHQTLADKEVDILVNQLMQRAETHLFDAVKTVALAYDYDAEQAGPQIFLLQKKYSDENDLPCVTYKEAVHSLNSILRMTDQCSSIPVSTGKNNLIFSLYEAMSAKQKTHISEGLTLADFSEEQRELVLSAARQLVLDSQTSGLRMALRHLMLLQDPHTVFTRMRLSVGEAFGYQGPFGINGAVWPFPLDNGFTSQISGAYTHTVIIPPKTRLTDLSAALPTVSGIFGFGYVEGVMHSDPTMPTEQDRLLSEGMLSGRLPSTLTLDEAMKKFKSPSSPELDASVDDAIGDKAICLFGRDYSSANRLIRAIGTLYGLQVLVPKEGKYFVALPQPQAILHPEDTAKELVRLTPLPLLHYYEGQSAHIALTLPVKPISLQIPEKSREMRESFSTEANQVRASTFATQACYFPAARRLCVIAGPHVPTLNADPVPVASLGSEPLRLLSLFALSGSATRQLIHLNKFKVPQCLANPDTLCLKMGMFVGERSQRVYARFGYKDGSGNFKEEGNQAVSRSTEKRITQ